MDPFEQAWLVGTIVAYRIRRIQELKVVFD